MKITGNEATNEVAFRLDEAFWVDDPLSRLHNAAPAVIQAVRLARLAFALEQEEVGPTVKEALAVAIEADGEFADPDDEVRFERDMATIAQDPSYQDKTQDVHVIRAELDNSQLAHLRDRARESNDDALGAFTENPDSARSPVEREVIIGIQSLAFTEMQVTGGIAMAVEQHFSQNL